jgi:hypothetical protein
MNFYNNEKYGNIGLSLVNQQERLSQITFLRNLKGGTEKYSFFIAGFIEGEGSLWASIHHVPKSRLGIQINLGFAVYQHVSGLPLLLSLHDYFHTGRVYLKPGSSDVWVFEINDRLSLRDKVIPFFEQYVLPFSCKFSCTPSLHTHSTRDGTFFFFKQLISLFDQKKHLDKQGLISCVRLVYQMNPFSKGKKRLRTLQETIDLISQHPLKA